MAKKDKVQNTPAETSMGEVLGITSRILKVVYIILIIGIVFLLSLIIEKWGILKFILTVLKIASPLFIGFVIAWILNPIVRFLKSKGMNKVLSALLVYLVFMIIIFLIITSMFPAIFNQIQVFLKMLPELLTDIESFVGKAFDSLGSDGMIDFVQIQNNLLSGLGGAINDIANGLPNTIMNGVSKIASGLVTTVMSLAIGLYMLFDFDNISSYFIKTIPVKYRFEVTGLLAKIGHVLRRTVNGTLTCALLIFLSSSLGFALIGLEAPLLFGLICGITDLIPYIGPWIGGALAVIVGFTISPWIGILAIIVVVVVQQLENLVIQPLIMSKAGNLHPVVIIIGLLIFGHFFGIIGMIIATPVISLFKVLAEFIIQKFNLFDYGEYELTDNRKDK